IRSNRRWVKVQWQARGPRIAANWGGDAFFEVLNLNLGRDYTNTASGPAAATATVFARGPVAHRRGVIGYAAPQVAGAAAPYIARHMIELPGRSLDDALC
ncbi:hypothetical protein, partial [Ensifer aridi]|uniref:hypothetical protein n=1 Tax=Ensifer aridi TaxID=1708715 RepID=UPI001AECBF28